MIDMNKRVKNRIKATHDLNDLWQKLRDENFLVYEDEDYEHGEHAPYHLICIETQDERFVADVLYRDKTEKELDAEKEFNLKPFLQEIERIEY